MLRLEYPYPRGIGFGLWILRELAKMTQENNGLGVWVPMAMALLVASCASTDIARPVSSAPKDKKTCQIDWGDPRANSSYTYEYPKARVAKCPVEHNIYHVGKSQENEKNSIANNVYYVEFTRKNSKDIFKPDDSQVKELQKALESKTSKNIIYFVHGFRNSANARTGDPARFATLMAYMTFFTHARCHRQLASEKCAETIGVFIDWPGEPISETNPLATPIALFQFNASREIADQVGPRIAAFMDRTTNFAREKAKNQPVRTMAFGHSLGGRALLAGLSDGWAKDDNSSSKSYIQIALDNWGNSKRTNLVLPGADLYVLANPATEATNWIRVQKAEAKTREYGDQRFLSNGNKSEEKTNGGLFHPAQPPRIIAFQSQCTGNQDSGPKEDEKIGFFEALFGSATSCDRATGLLFEIARAPAHLKAHLNGKVNHADYITMGHYLDNPKTPRFGLSHIITNYNYNSKSKEKSTTAGIDSKNMRKRTSIKNLLIYRDIQNCKILPQDWLYNSRIESEYGNWDTEKTAVVNEINELKGIVQSRYGIHTFIQQENPHDILTRYMGYDYWINLCASVKSFFNITCNIKNPTNGFFYESLAVDRYTPFWNAALDDSMGEKHGGFYSRMLLCHFTQLWLDARPEAK